MSTKFLSIFDDNQFIRVFDTQKSTTVYFNKSGLMVSNDNDKEFYIQSNNHIGYYRFENVAYPYATTIKNLVETLVSWIKKGSTDEWDLSTASRVMEIKMDVDENELNMDTFLYRGGVSMYDNTKKTVVMKINQTGTRVTRQSKQQITLRQGQDYLVILGGVMFPSGFGFKHIGVGINSNNTETGYFAEYSPGLRYPPFEKTRFNFLMSPTATYIDFHIEGQTSGFRRIIRSSWNIDKLDGSGPSGINVDFTQFQYYVFELKHRNNLAFKAGVLYNNKIIWCHDCSEYNANIPWESIIRHIPLNWEIGNYVGSLGTILSEFSQMEQGYSIVYARQSNSSCDISSYSTSTAEPKFLNASDSNKHIMTLTLDPQSNRTMLRLTKLKFQNTQQGYALWELVLSPTTVNESGQTISSPTYNTFVDIPRSKAMKSEADIEITGGTVLLSGYITSLSKNEIDLDESLQPLLTALNGTPDKISVRVSGMYGTSYIHTSISWKE